MLVFGDLPARCDILIFKYIVSESSNLSVSVLCISLLMLLENITSMEYLGALGVEIWQYSYASLYNVHCLWKHQRVSCRYGGIICSSVPLPLSLKYFIFVSLVYRLFSVFCTSIMHSGWQISICDCRLLSTKPIQWVWYHAASSICKSNTSFSETASRSTRSSQFPANSSYWHLSLVWHRWIPYFVSVDEFLEDDVGGDDPDDGDEEAPPDGHVGDVPAPKHDAPEGLARERLWQAVRYVPGNEDSRSPLQ